MGSRAGPTEAVRFFTGLQADNTKARRSAHTAFDEALVREPMAALLDELSGESGPGRIARRCRDVRFRADKPPDENAAYSADYRRWVAPPVPREHGNVKMLGDIIAR